jgi:SAM-dependent methyltransferase
VTRAPADDLLGRAMVDFAAGRRSPLWLRVAPGRRLPHDLAAYFASVTSHERALLDLAEEPVLDVGCGPARHARLLQARGVTTIGLDRSLPALSLARALGPGRCRQPARPCCWTATSAWPELRLAPRSSCIAWPRPVGQAGDYS